MQTRSNHTEQHETVIIGAGQSGLATAYHLQRCGREFVVLDGRARVGDNWRKHWDSLKLYSPARYDALPGLRFPAPRHSFPGRDDVAKYLEDYAARFDFPIRHGVRVDGLSRVGGRYLVTAGDLRFEADNVVVATGPWGIPSVPSFARELDPAIVQLHSSAYRNPTQLPDGDVLVVGASHSGADIALEASATHRTILAGPYRGEIPFALEGRRARAILPVLWFAATRVLTVSTPVGRKMRPEVRSHGGPLLRVRAADLAAAGVEHVDDKVVAAGDGRPVLENGRALDVAAIVWCTGFHPNYSWIDLPITAEDGYPEQVDGAVTGQPGLFMVGMPFLRSFSSMLVGGAGRDAKCVADAVVARHPRPTTLMAGPTISHREAASSLPGDTPSRQERPAGPIPGRGAGRGHRTEAGA